jgi:hypothetical protein
MDLQRVPVTCSQEALDRHLHVVGVFLEPIEVYNVTIILLNKLDLYEVRSSLNMWFKSYLTNRT